MKQNKVSRLILLSYAVAALGLIAVALCYPHLPAEIPMHWGIDGTVRYDARWTIWGMAALGPVFAVLMPLMPRLDPKKKNYDKFQGSYDLFCLLLQVFLLFILGVILTESLRPGTVNVQIVVNLLVGVLFVFLGNMMPKFRFNYFCGLRTPWALANETVWVRTQRAGGRMMFVLGLLIMAAAFLPGWAAMAVIVGGVIMLVVGGYWLSWRYFQDEVRGKSEE